MGNFYPCCTHNYNFFVRSFVQYLREVFFSIENKAIANKTCVQSVQALQRCAASKIHWISIIIMTSFKKRIHHKSATQTVNYLCEFLYIVIWSSVRDKQHKKIEK